MKTNLAVRIQFKELWIIELSKSFDLVIREVLCWLNFASLI